MNREELNETALGLYEAFSELVPDEGVLCIELKHPTRPPLTLLIGNGKRGDQIRSFADAMNLADIPLAKS